MAKENGADYFTTTLSISPLKKAEKLNEIGRLAGEEYGVSYLPSDFKKRGDISVLLCFQESMAFTGKITVAVFFKAGGGKPCQRRAESDEV